MQKTHCEITINDNCIKRYVKYYQNYDANTTASSVKKTQIIAKPLEIYQFQEVLSYFCQKNL